MIEPRIFYDRYWNDAHIKINPFDKHPGEWSLTNFNYHMDFFRPYIKGRLLDFGCGTGEFLNLISRISSSAFGLDVSKVAIEKAKSQFPSIEFSLLGEKRLPYADGYFDTVCAIDVLEHILDLETVLEEINRVLKPGGNFLVATSQITRIKIMLIALNWLDKYFYPTSPHIRYFTRNNLADILTRKGFNPIAYKKNRAYFGFIPQGQMVVASKKK